MFILRSHKAASICFDWLCFCTLPLLELTGAHMKIDHLQLLQERTPTAHEDNLTWLILASAPRDPKHRQKNDGHVTTGPTWGATHPHPIVAMRRGGIMCEGIVRKSALF